MKLQEIEILLMTNESVYWEVDYALILKMLIYL